MTVTPIIEPDCDFGSALTDGDIKGLLSNIPDVFMQNGFVCTNAQIDSLDNTQLGGYFTGLFAFLYDRFANLHENQPFSQCLWDNFICEFVQDSIFFGSNIGGASVSVSLPAGGTYRYVSIVNGVNGGTLTNNGNSRHFFLDTGSNGEIINGNFSGTAAGGTAITATQAGFANIMMTVFAVRSC